MDKKFILLLVSFLSSSTALDNGLALTPPMGWLTWQRFRCIIDCNTRPNECISERLILRTADLMVSEGYLDAGYDYIGIDDCWSEFERDENQRLVANKERFPNGMKYVADYVHSKGLKFGIYGDYGTLTCGGYPGTLDYMEIDAETFGDWGVDYVKLDGCYVELELMDEGYPKFGELLNNTGRPMLYSCSWPVYQELSGITPNWDSIIKNCNMWRNYYDIQDSWYSVEYIMNYFGENSRRLATYAGPGHWNDPDMLIIGNFGLSYDQSKSHMAVWAILAAPLLISTDLEVITDQAKELLLNKDLIAINQDPLARAGIRVFKKSDIALWKREITPVLNNTTSVALAFVNHDDSGAPKFGNYTFKEMEIDTTYYYDVEFLLLSPTQSIRVHQDHINDINYIEVLVNPTGVAMLKLKPTQIVNTASIYKT
ncbi:alpha-N-acetylgalactosaminidase-like [Arctopsyche grandis]|uniref:alpha-N-acetylgalactosaminidase-like n=1 Tax=Arctopsyche grandis TaxID=121162 RepID=UPI00406D881D